MINTILWDFDGTLVDTNRVVMESWQITYEHYYGHRMPEEHITQFFGEPLLVTMEREFPMADPAESCEVYRKYQREFAYKLVDTFPGVFELVRTLKERGYKQCIVTSRTRVSADLYLGMFGMDDAFDGMVTCDDTDSHKPNPEPILLGLEKMKCPKDEAIMIGDGVFDVKCANNAGVKCVLVGWRITDPGNQLITDAVHDYEVKDTDELLRLIEELS